MANQEHELLLEEVVLRALEDYGATVVYQLYTHLITDAGLDWVDRNIGTTDHLLTILARLADRGRVSCREFPFAGPGMNEWAVLDAFPVAPTE